MERMLGRKNSMHTADFDPGVLRAPRRWLRKLTGNPESPSPTPAPTPPCFGAGARVLAPTPLECGRAANVSRHAAEFLAALKRDQFTGDIRYQDMHRLYRSWCQDTGCREIPWNTLAFELRYLLGGKKSYRWFWDEAGAQHRVRVYRLSAEPSLPHGGTTEEQHLMG
jgi:hypothetical protein